MMPRTYHNRADDHAGFIVVILVVCAYWAHKAVMHKIEHGALIIVLIVAALFFLVWLVKFFKKFSRWHQRHNPNLVVIDNMTGLEFERYVARLLKSRGYSRVQLTEEYDFGIDIIAEKNGERWGIQEKRYSGLVKADVVRQVVTALKFYQCSKAMVFQFLSQPF